MDGDASSSIGGNDSYTKLLLHMDGDQGNTGHNVTSNGNPKLDGTTKKFGSSSMYFDGTGDYLTIPDHADWNFGSDDFVIDLWVNIQDFDAGDNYPILMGQYNSSQWSPLQVYYDHTNGDIYISASSNGSSWDILSGVDGGTLSENVWAHLAWVRSGNNFYTFKDGVRISTTDVTGETFWNAPYPFGIGAKVYDGGVRQHIKGYIDELRISKGTDRGWTGASFTLPTSEYSNDEDTKLLLHFNGDESASGHNVTFNGNPMLSLTQEKWNGSYYFDGTGDYITIPDHADWAFGSNNFVLECWAYFNSTSGDYDFFRHWSSPNDKGFQLSRITADSKIYFWYTTNGSTTKSNGGVTWTPSLSTWYHIAVVRSGSDLKIFVDGSQVGSMYNIGSDSIPNITAPLWIGGTNYMNGFIDEVRVSAGTDRGWSSGFSVPTTAYSTDVYKLSGTLSDAGRIIVFDESSWTILDNDTYSTGSYEIDLGTTASGKVMVAARKSDGELMCYGNITPQLSS